MIVCPMFEDDRDDALMYAQHSVYNEVIVELVSRARAAQAAAEKLTGACTVLGDLVRDLERFDHRNVQGAHDLIAAWYRYLQSKHPLFTRRSQDDAALRDRWRRFATEEIGRLLEDGDIARLLLTAIAFGNVSTGMAAERELAERLRQRYWSMVSASREMDSI